MLSQENVNFIRYVLLLLKVGTELLGKIMQISLNKETKTIDQLLTAPGTESKVCGYRYMTNGMKLMLYPPQAEKRNVAKWDIALLSFIILEFLKTNLNTLETAALEKIRGLMEEISHKPEPVIDGKTFTSMWTELLLVIKTLGYGLSVEDSQYYDDIIRSITNVELDLSDAIGEIKSLVKNCHGDIENLHQNVKTLEILHRENYSKLEDDTSVRLIVSCNGAKGMEHVLSLFENGSACNSLNGLSTALSDIAGKPVRLDSSIVILKAQGEENIVSDADDKINSKIKHEDSTRSATFESEKENIQDGTKTA